MDSTWLWVIPISGILALAFVIYLVRDVLSRDEGTPEMKAVSDTIYEGAIAFIRRQYVTIAVLSVVTAIVVAILVSQETITETDFQRFRSRRQNGYRIPGRRCGQRPQRYHRHVCCRPLECACR
jgi:hypothetical protein